MLVLSYPCYIAQMLCVYHPLGIIQEVSDASDGSGREVRLKQVGHCNDQRYLHANESWDDID